MPWQFGHICQRTGSQCVSVGKLRDKHHTVPTLLHCVLRGADLGKFAIQNNFLKRIFFRLMNTEFGRQGLNCTEQQRETILWLAYPWLFQKKSTKVRQHVWEITIVMCWVFLRVHSLICQPGSLFQANRKFYMFQQEGPSSTNRADKLVRKRISVLEEQTPQMSSSSTESAWRCLTAVIKGPLKYTLLSLSNCILKTCFLKE